MQGYTAKAEEAGLKKLWESMRKKQEDFLKRERKRKALNLPPPTCKVSLETARRMESAKQAEADKKKK